MEFRGLVEKLKAALGKKPAQQPRPPRPQPESKKLASPKPKAVQEYRVIPLPIASHSHKTDEHRQTFEPVPPESVKPQIDLFIGFDLGTSSSKVVVGNPEMESSFPVVFRDDQNGVAKFLLPTAFREVSGGCELVRTGSGTHSNFKLRLMNLVKAGGEDRDEDIIDLTVYSALVLRDTLQWFQETHGRDYAHFDVVWNLAVGFPRKKLNKEGFLENAYREAFHAASNLLKNPKSITRSAAREALVTVRAGTSGGGLIEPELIEFWPEIAAQLAGYMRSPYHRNGNLVLVDIGAGTLDVSAIILHGVSESRKCSFHHCTVKPLGALVLFQARQKALLSEGVKQEDLKSVFASDPLARVPEELIGYVNRGVTVSASAERSFQIRTRRFIDEGIEVVRERMVSFRQAQKRGHRNTAYDPWPGHLPVILSGGGSRLRLYDHALRKQLEEKLRPSTRWAVEKSERERMRQGLEIILMPVPDDLKTNEALQFDFDRISVAHGLAYGAENLPQVTNASEKSASTVAG